MGGWNKMMNVEWQFADKEVSREEIDAVSKKIGYRFPLDYILCSMVNHGANVEPEVFDVGHKQKVFGSLLSFDESSPDNFLKVYENYKETLPTGVIPFAFDPAGNLICFDYKESEDMPKIVFWEHEGAWEKSILVQDEGLSVEQAEERARENIFFVANSFTELLESLHD
ncbi:hypothetical protein PAECIP111890_05732 [Paenibacillus sp. JJ-223]|nr:hypothetical protein PAECIP111890_05732 [Paenibacillus sp. JJ-223]